jgi:hypothetical protein
MLVHNLCHVKYLNYYVDKTLYLKSTICPLCSGNDTMKLIANFEYSLDINFYSYCICYQGSKGKFLYKILLSFVDQITLLFCLQPSFVLIFVK